MLFFEKQDQHNYPIGDQSSTMIMSISEYNNLKMSKLKFHIQFSLIFSFMLFSSSSQRKVSSERKSSQVSDRRETTGMRGASRDYSNSASDYSRKSSSKDYSGSGGRDFSTSSKEYARSSRDYSANSSSSRDYTSPLGSRNENTSRSSSPVKIGLSALK